MIIWDLYVGAYLNMCFYVCALTLKVLNTNWGIGPGPGGIDLGRGVWGNGPGE